MSDWLLYGCEDKLFVPGELLGDDGAGLQQAWQPVPQPRARRRRHADDARHHHRQRTQRLSLYIIVILHTDCSVNHDNVISIAQEPRDAVCQLKSCQMLHSCTKNYIWQGMQ